MKICGYYNKTNKMTYKIIKCIIYRCIIFTFEFECLYCHRCTTKNVSPSTKKSKCVHAYQNSAW